MAMTLTETPAVRALRPAPGSFRLVTMRFGLAIVATLPGVLGARASLNATVGRSPWFATAPDPLPVLQLSRLVPELGAAVAPLLAGVAVAWLAHLLLSAAAVEILDPELREEGALRIGRRIATTGAQYVWAYLRVAIVSMVLLMAGLAVLGVVFDGLVDHAARSRWSGHTVVMTIPITRLALTVAWAGAVGTLAWWIRAIAVLDRRRHLRRLVTALVRLSWRAPLQAFALVWLSNVVTVMAGALVLFLWRQSPGSGTPWFALWLAVLMAQACLWHWRLRMMCLAWRTSRFDELRQTPDEPWRWLRRLRSSRRREERLAAPAAASQ